MKKMILLLLVSALTLLTGCMGGDGGDTVKTENIHPSENMMARSSNNGGIIVKTYENTIAANLGNGYNSVKDAPSQLVCIEYDAPTDFEGNVISSEGQTTTYYKASISESSAEVSQSMNVSAGASVNYGMFSGSVSGDAMNSSEKSTHDVFVYAYVDIIGPSASITNVRLKEAYQKTHSTDAGYVGKSNASDVYEICGDYYAGTITTGARLHAIFQFSTTTDSEKQSLKADLDASVKGLTGGSGGSITASSASDFASVVSEYNTTVTSFITGCGAKIVGNDMESFLNAVTTFPDEINSCMSGKTVGDIMSMANSVTYYSMNEMIEDSFGTTDAISDILASKTNIARLINSYASFEGLQSDINTVLNNTGEYEIGTNGNYTLAELNQILDDITTPFTGYLATLQNSMDVCASETFNCDYPDDAGLPEISAIRSRIPGHNNTYPKDCLDYQETLNENVSGHLKTVYLNNDPSKPINVYCEMTEGVMSTYINLEANPVTTDHPNYLMTSPFYQQGQNFSGMINYWQWRANGSLYWPDIMTVYERVRLVNGGVNTVDIDQCDAKFADSAMYVQKTTTWPLGNAFGCAQNQIDYAPYGSGVGSYHGEYERDNGISLSNIVNLAGTPFRISPSTSWEFTGTRASGTESISGDRKTVSITSGGDNGFFRPKAHGKIGIELEYVGN